MTAGDFDIVGAGWGPDFDDIMTFGDLFASWNLNNRGRYNNPEYDAAVRVAMNSTDPRTRMDAMAKPNRSSRRTWLSFPSMSKAIYLLHPGKGCSANRCGRRPRLHSRPGHPLSLPWADIFSRAGRRRHHRLVYRYRHIFRHARRAGDPLMNEKAATPEIRANLAKQYGLDRPLPEQYVIFLGNMVQGDFGISFTQQNRRVNDITRSLPRIGPARGTRHWNCRGWRHCLGCDYRAVSKPVA